MSFCHFSIAGLIPGGHAHIEAETLPQGETVERAGKGKEVDEGDGQGGCIAEALIAVLRVNGGGGIN